MNKILTTLAARKMKYGFRKDYLRVDDFKALGALMHFLESYPKDQYLTELVGMSNNNFRLYTNNLEIAEAVLSQFVISQ